MDHGAALGLRFNCKGSVHQFQSLLHADEPKTTALLRRFGVKACAGILHWEMNLIRCSPQSYRTSKCRTPLCFAELCRASCSTRKKEREMSGDKGLAKSWVWKSIFAFCCSPNSWQKPLIAAAIPKYCSFAACNSCDKD